MLFGLGCGTFAGVMGWINQGPTWNTIITTMLLEFTGLVGIVYLVCAAKIRRGNRTAGIVAIALAAVQEGFALLMLLSLLLRRSQINLIMLFVILLAVLAFAQLIYHLFRFLRPIENFQQPPIR